jgi:hypothetical protein
MTGLETLWLPLLLSSVIVFIASSVIHMLLPWHKSDYPLLPNQDAVMDAMRPLGIPPGDYMIPRPADRKDMGPPEFAEKMKKGRYVWVAVATLASLQPLKIATGSLEIGLQAQGGFQFASGIHLTPLLFIEQCERPVCARQ